MRRLSALLLALALGLLGALAVPAGAQYGGGSANPLHLYGDSLKGWGSSPGTLSIPGPALSYLVGTRLTLILHSLDGMTHNLFVDYDNSCTSPGGCNNASKPSTGTFSTSALNWFNITLDRQGQFTYRCLFHSTTMYGTVTVSGGEGIPSLAIIIGVVVAVVVVGAVGGIVLMRRRSRSPPQG